MIKDSEKDKLSDEDKLNLEDEVAIDINLVDDLESENQQPIEGATTTQTEDDSSGHVANETDEQEANQSKKASLKNPVSKARQSKDDKELDEAINDIASKEADLVLEIEDSQREALALSSDSIKQRGFRAFLRSLWQDPKKRWACILIFSVSIVVALAIPDSRYLMLNTAGVRASVELRVVDSSTLQPLKNVTVKVAKSEAKTNDDGFARLTGVRLGRTNIKIEKRAFASIDRSMTVGWGSNPIGDQSVDPAGSQYTFYVKDFLSHKPLNKVEAMYDDASAFSDESGKIVLVVDTATMDDNVVLSVKIGHDGYRQEELEIPVNNREAQNIDMVPSRPHVFVSKRSGKFDVYAVDIDGKNERKILDGQGIERDDMSLLPHPTKNQVVYIATRENVRNSSGYLLSSAYIIDLDNDDVIKFDQSEQIKPVGWTDKGRLVYVKMAAGESGTSPDRHRLMSFDPSSMNENAKELASSNYFNSVVVLGSTVYYAPSNIFNEEPAIATYSIKADGKDKKSIINQEVFEMVRTDYRTVYFNTYTEGWYRLVNDNNGSVATKDHAPGTQASRAYIDGNESNFSLWVDNRDGKGVLLSYDKSTDHEKVLVQVGGLKYPIYWLDNENVVYRVRDGRETADYIVNTVSGDSRKITDVTDTSGVSAWY